MQETMYYKIALLAERTGGFYTQSGDGRFPKGLAKVRANLVTFYGDLNTTVWICPQRMWWSIKRQFWYTEILLRETS